MACCDPFRCNPAQVEQRKAERWCQERRLQVHRDHDRHPFRVERTTVNDGADNWDNDVNDLKEIKHEPEHEEHEHHDQENRQLIVETLEELLDIVLATEGNHDKVQDLRAYQDEPCSCSVTPRP